jgi:hypothetical protein
MSTPNLDAQHPDDQTSSSKASATRSPQDEAFLKNLEQNGQLRDVQPNEDVSKLPPGVTHVRYPDGTVKRRHFTAF